MENILILVFIIIIFIYLYININSKVNHRYINIVPEINNEFIDNNQIKDVYYKSIFIPKDTMNSDPGNKNYYKVSECDKPYKAWSNKSDVNNPIYYKSDFNTNMLGMKHFYDLNNKFHLKPIDNKLTTTRKFFVLV